MTKIGLGMSSSKIGYSSHLIQHKNILGRKRESRGNVKLAKFLPDDLAAAHSHLCNCYTIKECGTSRQFGLLHPMYF